jgi:phage FluMu gp28-like protein
LELVVTEPIITPRLVSETEWAETRRAGMLASAELAAQGDNIADVLLGYQKRLLSSTAHYQVTICEKSRRIGATWGVGADAVLTSAAMKSAGGMDTFYIGYNLDMAREFIDVCAMWARGFGQAAGEVQEFVFDDGDPDSNIKAFRIRFASGYEIIALPSRPRSLRGMQGYVIIDEAAFHDDLEAVMQAALALLIWGGKVLVISTHLGEDNAFNKLVTDVRAGRKPYNLVRITFDDALHDGLYRRICQVRGLEWSVDAEAKWRAEIIGNYGEAADEELFCIPSKGGGIYFPRALIEARMVEDLPVFRLERPSDFTHLPKAARESDIDAWCREHLELPLKTLDKGRQHAVGEDFGRVSDLTDIVPIEIGRTLIRTVPFVVELRNIPFEQQRQVLFYVCDRLPRFIGGKMDATGNGAYLAEVAAQRYGAHRIEQVKISATWYLENFPPLKAAFEDNAIIIPKDDEHLGDLTLVRQLGGIPQIPAIRTKAKDGKKRHGDFAVGLVLAYAATRADVVEYDYRAVTSAADVRGSRAPDDDADDERKWWRTPLGAGLRGNL